MTSNADSTGKSPNMTPVIGGSLILGGLIGLYVSQKIQKKNSKPGLPSLVLRGGLSRRESSFLQPDLSILNTTRNPRNSGKIFWARQPSQPAIEESPRDGRHHELDDDARPRENPSTSRTNNVGRPGDPPRGIVRQNSYQTPTRPAPITPPQNKRIIFNQKSQAIKGISIASILAGGLTSAIGGGLGLEEVDLAKKLMDKTESLRKR
jgi:hypothetical protein